MSGSQVAKNIYKVMRYFSHSFRIRNDFYLVCCLRFFMMLCKFTIIIIVLDVNIHTLTIQLKYSLAHKTTSIKFDISYTNITMNICISRSSRIKRCYFICILDSLNETNYVQIISLNIDVVIKNDSLFCVCVCVCIQRTKSCQLN